MMRHLTTFALAGILGSLLMAGNAEACHKKKCACAPVVCAPAPVICYQPAPCPRPVKVACAPKVKKCGGGGLFAGLCHKKQACAPAPCGTPVAYAYNYPTVAPTGQYIGTPQTGGMPPVPAKSMGTPQR
jgi:hypothetical protein